MVDCNSQLKVLTLVTEMIFGNNMRSKLKYWLS